MSANALPRAPAPAGAHRAGPSVASRLLEFALPYKRSALLSVLFVMLNVALGLVSPLLYRKLVDDGLRAGNAHIVLATALAIAATVVLTALAQMLEEFFSCWFGLVMMNDVRNRLYQHLVQLPMGFYLTTGPGSIINRFTSDLLNVQRVVARTLPSMFTNMLMIAAALVMMSLLSWQLTLVTVVAVPLYALFAAWVSRIVARISAQAKSLGDRMISTLGEDFGIEGFTLFKLFGASRRRGEEFELLTAKIQRTRLQLVMWSRANATAIDAVQSMGVVAIYAVGGCLLFDGRMMLDTSIAFAAIAGLLEARSGSSTTRRSSSTARRSAGWRTRSQAAASRRTVCGTASSSRTRSRAGSPVQRRHPLPPSSS